MDQDVLDAIARLLRDTRVLSLAVVLDGEPEAGLLPYACREDFGALYVQASRLARHARALQPGTRVGLLVHANDAPDGDPMQLPRLMVQGTVAVLDKGSETFATAARQFVARFPHAAMTLEFDDFSLYELTLGRGRYVEGFARAFNVDPATFVALPRG
jgi:hypothetical protein